MFKRLLPDSVVEYFYLRAGTKFGSDVSYIPMVGESYDFEAKLNAWASWEVEYARREYVTLSVDDFIEIGGYDQEPDGLGVKRSPSDKLILHAERYRNLFLGRVSALFTPDELMTAPQRGTYILPSTENTPPAGSQS